MKKYFLLLALLPLSFTSCGESAPDGMPTKVYPCTITVKNGATPLVDATISLIPESDIPGAIVAGKTDANGVAKVSTMIGTYMKEGAPEGKFKVVVQKEPDPPHTKSAEERSAMDPGQAMEYEAKIAEEQKKLPKIVPPAMASPKNTPLTMEVTSAGGSLDVDVSANK